MEKNVAIMALQPRKGKILLVQFIFGKYFEHREGGHRLDLSVKGRLNP